MNRSTEELKKEAKMMVEHGALPYGADLKGNLEYDEENGRFKGKIESVSEDRMMDLDADASVFSEDDLRNLQVVVCTMCGGGMLGDFAMRQPADFYIDDRVATLPYSRKAIYRVVKVLDGIAKELGKDPHRLDAPRIPGAWVF